MRGHNRERPVHRDEEGPPLAATRESPSTETKTQHSNQSINQSFKKKNSDFWVPSPEVDLIYLVCSLSVEIFKSSHGCSIVQPRLKTSSLDLFYSFLLLQGIGKGRILGRGG